MENKWTPGPWKVVNEQIKTPTGMTLRVSGVALPCGRVTQEDESYANAHLIAAAPELYEAVEKMCSNALDLGYCHMADCHNCNSMKALAKARGETGERGE